MAQQSTSNKRQLMLWETTVSSSGDGSARVVAKKPLLEGSVYEARKILGGVNAVSNDDIYKLIRQCYIVGWKNNPGVERSDGRGTNCKWVIDLESVYKHREAMQNQQLAARRRPAEKNVELF